MRRKLFVAVDTNPDTGLFTHGMNAVRALRMVGVKAEPVSIYEPRKLDEVVVIGTVNQIGEWTRRSRRVYAYVPIEGFIKSATSEQAESLRRAYSVATTSEFSRRMLSAVRSDVHVVEPGIDFEYYSRCGREREFDVGIVLSASHIGAEELAIRKGVDLYDEVLRSTSYTFIANKHLMRYVKSWRRATMLVDSPSYVYGRAKVLLWLSRCEGFGLPPLEAMACGTPVVFTDAPAHNQHSCCYPIPIRYTWVFDNPRMSYTFLMHEPNMDSLLMVLDQAIEESDYYRDYVQELARRYDLASFGERLLDWLTTP